MFVGRIVDGRKLAIPKTANGMCRWRVERVCAPQTLNHIRGYLSRAFNAGRKTERFRGPNPVADVKKRRIPKTVPDFLRAEEVSRVLAALSDRWRSLFATALFTGLRKGEPLGLRSPSD